MKKTRRGVLLLVNLQADACNFAKSNAPPCVLLRFLNYSIGNKSRKAARNKGMIIHLDQWSNESNGFIVV